jgi:hypothetical protein
VSVQCFSFLVGSTVMSQIYTSELREMVGRNRRAPEDRLPQRTGMLAIIVLSLLLWLPILLPLAALLHR